MQGDIMDERTAAQSHRLQAALSQKLASLSNGPAHKPHDGDVCCGLDAQRVLAAAARRVDAHAARRSAVNPTPSPRPLISVAGELSPRQNG